MSAVARLLALTIAALPIAAAGQVVSAPAASAACTPSISMGKPVQDPHGWPVWTIDYTTCDEPLLITLKHRLKDDPDKNIWYNKSFFTADANSSGQWVTRKFCIPDGLSHRYLSIATLRTLDKTTLVAKTPRVFVKLKPTTDCAY
jgi:hypothetical protein